MQGELLLSLALHLALTALPGAAAALLAARCGVRRVPVLLALALAASGLVGILGFWTYYGGRVLGETFSYFVLLGSVLLAGWSLWGGRIGRETLRSLATPLLLWALGSAFLVFLGFLYGGTHEPIVIGGTRFSGPLPADNALPMFFANWFYLHGHHGIPPELTGGWSASDRPPLQVGYVLSQRPFFAGSYELEYQVLGVVLQQLWIVALWALLLAARVGRVARGLALAVMLVSDLAILNGFFVWPKLLPAAMLVAAAALVLTPLWGRVRQSLAAAALLATLCGLAMLGHGSSVFGIIPLALIGAWRGLPGRAWIAVAVAVGIVLLAPWSAYQKYGDPPGNRLVKWMLAGVIEPDERGSLETVVDSYREAGLGGAVHNKAENFVTMAGGAPALEAAKRAFSGSLSTGVTEIRVILFFNLLPSLGLLLLGPVAMALRRRRGPLGSPEWNLAVACLATVAIGAVCWGLVIFGNGAARTIIHVGSYALPLLALCGCVVGLRAAFPSAAIWVAAASCILTLAIYVPYLEAPAGTAFSPLSALLSALALGGFLVVAFSSPRPAEATAPLPVAQRA